MTSSFGTVVGTPRDDLPDISDTNYQNTSANLAGSVNKEIDRVTDDARVQSRFLEQIIEAQKSPLDRLKQLADFSKSAGEFADVVSKANKLNELNATAKDGLSEAKINLENKKKENLLRLDAETDGALLEDNDPLAKDLFIATATLEEGEHGNIRKVGNELLPKVFAGAGNWRTENGFATTNTKLEAIDIYDQSEDLVGMSILYQYEQAGVDINSKAFEREWVARIYPELLKEKEKALQLAENRINYNAEKILGNKTNQEIRDGLDAGTDDNPFNTQNVLINIKKRYRLKDDKEALAFLFKTVRESVKNKDGIFFPEDLTYLENEALFYDKSRKDSDNPFVVFDDLNVGKGDDFKNVIRDDNLEVSKDFFPDVNSLNKAAVEKWKREIYAPIAKEANIAGGGTFTQKQSVDLRVAWESNPGTRDLPFPLELLGPESLNYTSNEFGKNQFSDYPNGVGQPQDPLILNGLKELERKYLKTLNDNLAQGETRLTVGTLSLEQKQTLDRAKGELIESLNEIKGLETEFNVTTVSKRVEQELDNIADGAYAVPDTGLQFGRVENVNDYVNKVNADRSILQSKEVIDIYEKPGLEAGLDALLNNRRLPQYWIQLGEKLKMSPTKLLLQRLAATGGYNEETQEFLLDKTYYKLSKEEREVIERNPSINTSIAIFYDKKSKGKVEDLMNGSRNLVNVNGKLEYAGDGYYVRDNGSRTHTYNNGDDLSINKLIKLNANSIGRYGFSKQDLLDIKAYAQSKGLDDSLLDFNGVFDENAQTQALAILWKSRIEAKNGIRGFDASDAKTSGSHKMSTLSEKDIELLNEIFPKLKDADFFAHWGSHSDDLNNLFLSDKEVAQEAIKEQQNSIITSDIVAEFITNNRDNKDNKFKATVDGELVNFRKKDGSLITDIEFTDLNKKAQLAILREQGLKFKGTDIVEIFRPSSTKRKR
tara:strand:+ start:222 stop:3044 length:2823 start_codon:yes stop_codon:yes gene_type:complete